MDTGVVADIGGTNIRLAMTGVEGLRVESIRQYNCADFPGPVEAVRAYWKEIGETSPASAAFAVATPVSGDAVHLTNSAWSFSQTATQSALGLKQLLVINDFEAVARALPYLVSSEYKQIGGGASMANAPMVALGPGTGLGVAALVPDGTKGWVPVAGEGGHMSFSPANAFEAEVLKAAWQEQAHVSAERLLSGIGLPLLYRAVAQVKGHPAEPDMTASDIGERALAGSDALSRQVINTFCAMLGTVASNVALVFGARAGVFIGGGIVLKILPLFEASQFRQRFEEKGRFSAYLKAIPTAVILSPYPALIGLRAAISPLSSLQKEATA